MTDKEKIEIAALRLKEAFDHIAKSAASAFAASVSLMNAFKKQGFK